MKSERNDSGGRRERKTCMTQIKSYIGPTRRPGELGVHSIDHFNLVVPSLKDAERFYLSFGLDVRAEGDALSVMTHGAAHRWGALVEGPQKKLSYLSFGAFADDLPRFREKLQSCDVRQIDPPPGFESNGIWFRDPDGLLIEVRVGEKTSPNEKPVCINEQGRIGAQNAPNRSAVSPVRPRRLAHILIFASDVARAIRFYTSVLGLRLSDRSGDGIAFMHGIHGSDHHLIALAKSNGPGLHHLSWDVESIHQIGLGAMQMADKGFSGGWGSAGTYWDRTFFTTSATPGAAIPNIPLISTTSRSTTIGSRAIMPLTTRFM